jgi:hypothetical protein
MNNKSMQIIMLLVFVFAVVLMLIDGEQMITRRMIVKPTKVHIYVPTFIDAGYPAPIQATPTVHPYAPPPTSTPWTPKQTPTQNPDI